VAQQYRFSGTTGTQNRGTWYRETAGGAWRNRKSAAAHGQGGQKRDEMLKKCVKIDKKR